MGGAIQSWVGKVPSTCFRTSAAARKWPILVMHEPMNTSSIFVPSTADRGLMSSGSLGHAKSGSVILFRSISIILWYSACSSGSIKTGFSSHSSMARARLSSVRASW